jgi:8-oxo-dGTP pyrophosphatase MutT (NUDIX family)
MSEASDGVSGIAAAIEQYGRPLERSWHYEVRKDTFLYWQMVKGKRAGEVIILLRRRNGRYVVHTKAFYPHGTYRLISGGIKPGEDLSTAVQRETWEETGLEIHITRFLGILHHEFAGQDSSLLFTSYVFEVVEEKGVLHVNDPHEAITGYREVTLAGLIDLAEQLEALPPDWNDWGRFRAMPHRFAVEVLTEKHA